MVINYPNNLSNAEKLTFLMKLQEKLRRWNNEEVKTKGAKWHKEVFCPKNTEVGNEILKLRPLAFTKEQLKEEKPPWNEEKKSIRKKIINLNLNECFDGN